MKNHFFLLCMDDASISHMADLGVRCVTVDDSQTPEEKKRSEVWVVRVKVGGQDIRRYDYIFDRRSNLLIVRKSIAGMDVLVALIVLI